MPVWENLRYSPLTTRGRAAGAIGSIGEEPKKVVPRKITVPKSTRTAPKRRGPKGISGLFGLTGMRQVVGPGTRKLGLGFSIDARLRGRR